MDGARRPAELPPMLLKRIPVIRIHHLVKTFWGWDEQQLADATLILGTDIKCLCRFHRVLNQLPYG